MLEFYKRALGAEERLRVLGPDGKRIMHAELKIGDSIVMVSEEQPDFDCRAPGTMGGPTSALYLYLCVPDVDAAFTRAVDAGAKMTMPVTDMFCGDRFGQVEDPSGHRWGLATHTEDVPPGEMSRRQLEFFAAMSGQKR